MVHPSTPTPTQPTISVKPSKTSAIHFPAPWQTGASPNGAHEGAPRARRNPLSDALTSARAAKANDARACPDAGTMHPAPSCASPTLILSSALQNFYPVPRKKQEDCGRQLLRICYNAALTGPRDLANPLANPSVRYFRERVSPTESFRWHLVPRRAPNCPPYGEAFKTLTSDLIRPQVTPQRAGGTEPRPRRSPYKIDFGTGQGTRLRLRAPPTACQ